MIKLHFNPLKYYLIHYCKRDWVNQIQNLRLDVDYVTRTKNKKVLANSSNVPKTSFRF